MFLTSKGGYTRDGEQWARGPFLALWCGDTKARDMRACVRHVHYTQCGQFMGGSVTLGGRKLQLSGAYGQDGLPRTAPVGINAPGAAHGEGGKYGTTFGHPDYNRHLPIAVWETLLPVPLALQDAFWAGGGHNSAGTEGPSMRAWALDNLAALKKAGHVKNGGGAVVLVATLTKTVAP